MNSETLARKIHALAQEAITGEQDLVGAVLLTLGALVLIERSILPFVATAQECNRQSLAFIAKRKHEEAP